MVKPINKREPKDLTKLMFSIEPGSGLGLAKTHANRIRNALTNEKGRFYERYHNLMGKLGIVVEQSPDPKGKKSWFLVKD